MNAIEKIESVLKFGRIDSHSVRVRARAVYLVGLVFVISQLGNQIGMFLSYGEIVFDHYVSAAAACLVLAAVYGLRYTLNFPFYAIFYSALIVIGIMAAAVPDHTGINSALLPLFLLGSVAAGFICGTRAIAGYYAVAIAAIWYLYSVSVSAPPGGMYEAAAFTERNFHRAFQCSIGLTMMSVICALFSHTMHEAFGTLEEKIDRAEENDREKTQFLANMSHELRTPMNGIIGISEILMETELDAEQIEMTAMVNQSGEALVGLISNALLFSQIESGSVKLTQDPFVLEKMMRKAAAPHRVLAAQKRLGFRLNIPENIPPMYIGDSQRLQHVVSSLIDNAVKFTAKGEVNISLSVTPQKTGKQRLLFTVKDTGIGIDNTKLDMIFDRFRQADESRKRNFGGTGLGLTVARGLMDLMGGEVSAMSRLGSGSIFCIKVDLEAADLAAQPTPKDIDAFRAA